MNWKMVMFPQKTGTVELMLFILLITLVSNYSDYKNSGNSKSTYARFNSGLNLLGWQLHSDASYTKAQDSSGEWKSNTFYLERGISQILGTLRVGDMYTSSDIFDSVRFRGVRVYRDMQMLPNSRQNFTPLVQGLHRVSCSDY